MTDYILAEYGENLMHYYKVLSITGKTGKVEPFRFLVVGYLNELMNSSMAAYITQQDYKAISNVLEAAMGVPLMPYHKWIGRYDTNGYSQLESAAFGTEGGNALIAPEYFTQVYRTE